MFTPIRYMDVDKVRWYRVTDLCDAFEYSRKNIAVFCRYHVAPKNRRKVTKESGKHTKILKDSGVASLMVVNDAGLQVLVERLREHWINRYNLTHINKLQIPTTGQ